MIGDQQDMFGRLRRLLPASWFPDAGTSPHLDAVLEGYAEQGAFVFALTAEARLQMRVATATGGFLDMIAADFFGTSLLRTVGQSDESFRASILEEILAARATRAALRQRVQRLTGRLPWVIEPMRPADCGAYGTLSVAPTANPSRSAYNIDADSLNYWGSISMPSQVMLIVRRKASTGIPGVSGWWYLGVPLLTTGVSSGAYYSLTATAQPGHPTFTLRSGRIQWGSLGSVLGYASDEEVLAAINAVKPAATTVWVKFEG